MCEETNEHHTICQRKSLEIGKGGRIGRTCLITARPTISPPSPISTSPLIDYCFVDTRSLCRAQSKCRATPTYSNLQATHSYPPALATHASTSPYKRTRQLLIHCTTPSSCLPNSNPLALTHRSVHAEHHHPSALA